MRTIWKFPLGVQSLQKFTVHENYKILDVQVQHHLGEPQVWIEVDTTEPVKEIALYTYGTGHEIEYEGDYVGTYQRNQGFVVFHVYDVTDTIP